MRASEYLTQLLPGGNVGAFAFGEGDFMTVTGVVRPKAKGDGIQFSPGNITGIRTDKEGHGSGGSAVMPFEWFDLPDEVILGMTVLGPVMVEGKQLPLAQVTIPYGSFTEDGAVKESGRAGAITARFC
jgi:hypothetical protein